MSIKQLPLLPLLLLLTACVGKPIAVERYTLPDANQIAGSDRSHQHKLMINNVQLADYLDGEGIVLQLDDIRIHQAREHLWAEAPGQQIQRGLRHRLAVLLSDTQVTTGHRISDSNAMMLAVEFERFQGHFDGIAVSSGHWQLLSQQGEILATEAFQLSSVLDGDGYPQLVRALGRNLDALAEQIASTVKMVKAGD